jgi:quercetin dioxygenase-like cupin family protein
LSLLPHALNLEQELDADQQIRTHKANGVRHMKGGATETQRVVTRRSLLAGGLAMLASAHPGFAEAAAGSDLIARRNGAMDIKRNGSRPSGKGPEAWFTGTVRVDPLFQAGDPARVSGGQVTFEPGARTMWHTHPLGQTLIVSSGLGWVQSEGGPVEEIRPGDVIWFPPGEKHWHGATATTAMTHIAVTESLDGKNVDWMEKVSDAQYRR